MAGAVDLATRGRRTAPGAIDLRRSLAAADAVAARPRGSAGRRRCSISRKLRRELRRRRRRHLGPGAQWNGRRWSGLAGWSGRRWSGESWSDSSDG